MVQEKLNLKASTIKPVKEFHLKNATIQNNRKLGLKYHDSYLNLFTERNVITPVNNITELYDKIKLTDKLDKPEKNNRLVSAKIYLNNPKRVINVNNSVLKSRARFNDYLEDLENNAIGSDAISVGSTIIPYIGLLYTNVNPIIKKKVGKGKIMNSLFNIIDLPFTEGYCFDACLKYCSYKPTNKKYMTLENIVKYCEINKLEINIINNYFNQPLKAPAEDLDNDEKRFIKLGERTSVRYCTKVKKWDYDYIYTHSKAKINILYGNGHMSIISSPKKIYYSDPYYYVEDGDKLINQITGLSKSSVKCVSLNENPTLKQTYCFFDLEAVVDVEQERTPFKPYNISYLICDREFYEDVIAKFEKEKMNVRNELIKLGKLKSISGFDCVNKFLWELKEIEEEIKLTLVSFNGANFDNYLLIEELNKKFDFDPSTIFYSNNSILNFKMFNNIDTFDLSKHLVGSLSSCCKSFKVFNAKTAFNHSVAQNKFENGELFEEKFVEETKLYNDYDVISLCCVFFSYEDALNKINFYNNGEGYPLYLKSFERSKLVDHKTIGSFMWYILKNYWEDKNIVIPVFELEDIKFYDDILKYSSAGRTDLTGDKPTYVDGKVVSLDVVSMYPYQMAVAKNYFPVGNIIKTDEYNENKIGYYYCDIDQSNLPDGKKIQCEKIFKNNKLEKNSWCSQNKLLDYFINSEQIKYLQEWGCDVVIKKGFYFSDKIKGCELFMPILSIMKIKVQQDIYKASKEKDEAALYNSCLRETAKLLMNSASGKVIEGLHLKNTKFVTQKDYISKYIDSSHNVIDATEGHVFISYDKEVEKEFKKHRPIFYGNLIYTYSQQYLFTHLLSKSGFYTDTDSCKILKKKADKIINEYLKVTPVGHWKESEKYDPRLKGAMMFNEDFKVFGGVEDELKKFDQKSSYYNKKKEYAIINNNPLKHAVHFKGLHIRYNDDGEITSNDIHINESNKHLIYDEAGEVKLNEVELIKYYENNNNKINDWEAIFKDLVIKGKDCSFLSNQFVKNLKNSKRTTILQEEKFKKNNNTIGYKVLIKTVAANKNKKRLL